MKKLLLRGVLVVFVLLAGVVGLACFKLLHQVRGQFFDSAGVQIHYTDQGQGDPVILVHGYTANSDINWRLPGILPALEKKFRVVTMDVRGHGLSEKPHDTAKYGVEMVNDVLRLMDHLKIQKAHLVGYSMGGFITLKFAAMHPERLISAMPCGAAWMTPGDPLCHLAIDIHKGLMGSGITGSLQRAVLGTVMDLKALGCVAEGFGDLAITEAELRKINVPVMAVKGGSEELVLGGSDLEAALPGFQEVLVPGGMHNTVIFYPEFLKAVESFLVAQSAKAAAPATPGAVRGEMVLARASHEWMSQQIEEPCVLPNPKQPGKLIMFYGAVPASNRVYAAIGKAWADASDPFTWHQDEANPIFRPGAQGWDSSSIRLDTVMYIPEEDAYYIYYSGTIGNVQDRIGLAICPAGDDGYSGVTADTILRYGDAPVLAPEPAAPYFEEMSSQAAVMREKNAATNGWDWYMYYSYRGKDGTLPGIRLATSQDGKHWTRQLNADDPSGRGQIFPGTANAYYEWHQIFKVDKTYVLSIEVGVEHGQRWRPGIAVSTDPVRGWTQLDLDTVLQTKWQGLYDDRTMFHVATPAFYEITGKWYLYVQACGKPGNDNYIDGAWEMWGIACDHVIPTVPGCASLYIPGVPTS